MNKVTLDLHYIKSIILFIGVLVALFMYFTGSVSLSEQKDKIELQDGTIKTLSSKFTKLEKDLGNFNNKVKGIDKDFIKSKKEFGIYKLMMYLDQAKEIYDFDYIAEEKEKTLTNKYFSHSLIFTIVYKSGSELNKILNVIENKYHNSFVSGNYKDGKLILKYNFYGVK